MLCLHCSLGQYLPQQLAGGVISQAGSCRQAQMGLAKQQQVHGLGCTCSSCGLVAQDRHFAPHAVLLSLAAQQAQQQLLMSSASASSWEHAQEVTWPTSRCSMPVV